MHIEVEGLNKWFGNYHAVQDISFKIEAGKLIGLLGPSGGGKTSLLRILAGLEQPDGGEIKFHGQLMNNIAPQERGIGFVFQHYALFKHMTVYDNVAFGLTVKKWPKERIRDRVAELLELTGLAGTEKRYPNQLSGGQRQRVAFARALAPEPQLLLLDEPFAAIDAKIRMELRTWLRTLIERVGITSIFVTHDQAEAIEVADEIMIIQQGRVEQMGTPWDIYKHPESPFVAEFIGESTIVTDIHRLRGFETAEVWSESKALIRPEYIEIGRAGELRHESASEQGVVKGVHFRGNEWLIEVQIGSITLKTYRSLESSVLAVGDKVQLLVHRIYVFHKEDHWMLENALKGDPMPIYI